MATIQLYSQDGKKKSDLKVSDKVFGLVPNAALVHQAVRTQQANRRVAIAHTKMRGEVSGGGKKPWKQKGTGRARVGSTRSPIWIGGGITFGPRSDRNFTLRFPKKAKKRAMCMALSAKLVEGKLFALDQLDLPEVKTKTLATVAKTLPASGELLLVIDKKSPNIELAAKNLESVWVSRPEALNIEDILKYRRVVMLEGAIAKIEELFTV